MRRCFELYVVYVESHTARSVSVDLGGLRAIAHLHPDLILRVCGAEGAGGNLWSRFANSWDGTTCIDPRESHAVFTPAETGTATSIFLVLTRLRSLRHC